MSQIAIFLNVNFFFFFSVQKIKVKKKISPKTRETRFKHLFEEYGKMTRYIDIWIYFFQYIDIRRFQNIDIDFFFTDMTFLVSSRF